MQRKQRFLLTLIVTTILVAPALLLAHASGPDAGKCGVPGESTCVECHTGTPLNGGPGSVSVSFSGGGSTYDPGVKQHLRVTVDDPNQRRWGFQLTARLAGNRQAQAGSFIPGTDGFTQIACASTDLISETIGGVSTCPSSQPLQYIEHTLQGIRPGTAGSATFEFDWTPPSSTAGNVVIYVAGNAANGDLNFTGDHIYTTTSTLTPTAGTSLLSSTLSHIASGGDWKTTISLQNLSPTPNAVTVSFFADDGSPQTLPFTVTQKGSSSTSTGSSLSQTIDPNATLLIESEAPASSQTLVGWAQVQSSVAVSGFAIFRQHLSNGVDSEGTSPLETRSLSDLILPYDNTSGFVTGAALVNSTSTSTTLIATIWDDSGTQIGMQSIPLNALGHTAFVVSSQFPVTSGRRGIIELQSASGGNIAGLGFRFSPALSFTSIPIGVRP